MKGERERAGNKARQKEQGVKEGSKMGDEKLPFSSCTVAEQEVKPGGRRRRGGEAETEGTLTSKKKKNMSLTFPEQANRASPLTSVKIQLPRDNFHKHTHTHTCV